MELQVKQKYLFSGAGMSHSILFLRPFQKTRQPLYPRYEMGKGIQAIALGKQVQAGVSQYESLLHLRLGGVRKDKLCIPKTRLR